eukprot:g4994.t1
MPSRAAGAGASAAAGAAAGAAGAAGAAKAASTPEEGSMESAKEEEILALEDATDALVPASTALVPAHGPPMSYMGLNVEARLRAMRPSALPDGEADGPQSSGRVEPTDEERGVSMDIKELLRAVMAQNAALKKEVGELRKEVKESKGKPKGAIEDAPRPPTTTPPPSPPKDPPPCTPVKGQKENSSQAWADLQIPEFPVSVKGDTMRRDQVPRGSGVPEVPGSWGVGGWGLCDGRLREADREGGANGEGLKELIKGSPLEQAAQSVLRQLGTSPTEGHGAEVIRSVELPPLQDLREGDLGSLILGDWIQLVTPTMKDLSATSWKWWEDVLNFAMVAYREWLQAEPVQRLYIRPRLPAECSGVWSRLEQRGQLMLINAVPQSIKAEILASRTTSSVEVLYALFRRYQPGGLAERSRLLRQLVDPKAPQSMNEVTEALRGWRRSLRRAQELEIATPDATLLLGALDKMSELVGKTSNVAFRMSSTRATLGVDVTPTLETVLSFADMLTAEAESLAISELQPAPEVKPVTAPTTKVKAMTAMLEEKGEKGTGKGRLDGKPEEKVCRFWGTDDGCRKGQECRFKHEWGGLDKKGRCFGCSGTGHSKKDCPTVKLRSKESPEKQAVKSVKEKVQTAQAKGDTVEAGPKTGGSDAGTSGEMKDLLSEATTLLKSLRPCSSMKAIRLSSLEVREGGRALLDGGATHCLRRTSSEEEWASAQEVNVELAAGSAVLRLLPWTRTLLTKEDVQVIVPLGVLISLGYEAVWEKTRFELTDPTGLVLDTKVENSCPTIDETLAHELIQEIERSMVRERARLAHLAGENIGLEVDPEEAKYLSELKDLFPEVPHHILERLLPKKGWTGEGLPWNRHERRRVRRSKEVVIHLFSGDSKRFWQKELEAESRAVICVDTVIDQGMNLLRDDIFSYLLDLADGGG